MSANNPAIFSTRPALDFQAAKATWLLLVLLLVGLRLLEYDGKISKAFADPWVYQFASIIAILRLLVPLLREPFLLQIDTQAETLTLGWFRVPWKRVLNIRHVQGRLSEQVSHSGTRQYFLLLLDNKQLLYIEASARWPLAKLLVLKEQIDSLHSV